MTVKGELNWIKDMQFVGKVGDGHSITLDKPEGGTGPSPMEALLIGVAGCTAMDIVSIMKKRRAALTALRVNISGERAEDFPKRYTRISIEYVLEGKSLSPKDVERAIDLSMNKYCSASASVNAPIDHSYRIVEKIS